MGCLNDKQISTESQNQQQFIISDLKSGIINPTKFQTATENNPKAFVDQLDISSEKIMSKISYSIEQDINQKKDQISADDDQHHKKQILEWKYKLKESYKQCRQYYDQHNIDKAYEICQQIHQLQKNLKEQDPQWEKFIDDQSERIYAQINKEYKDVLNFQKQIDSLQWEERSNKNGVTVKTRKDGNTVGVKIQSLIDVPFEVVIAVLIEVDLHKKFIPFMKVSRQEKIICRNCRIGYAVSDFPFFTARQSFFQGIAYDRLETNGSVFLYTRSIHDRIDIQQQMEYTPEINKKYIQLSYKYFVAKYEPLAVGKGRITIAMNADSKIQFVPLWIQDKLSQDYAANFLKNIVRISQKFKGSDWEQNVKLNPELFNFFQRVIFNFLNKRGTKINDNC